MNDFEEYIRQGEPEKTEKSHLWQTAIGLQEVDGLKPSQYLIEVAKQNIEGDITFEEVKHLIDTYYKVQIAHDIIDPNRTEEADKVSARIAEILSEKTFSLSPAEYLNIHRRLFAGIYSFAGQIRDYNITKSEWVLDGDTVLYAGADNLRATLEFDFEQEKKFDFKGLNSKQVIEHIAHFISFLWQIHIFGEGNTRTTAVFLIKYLRKLGFKDISNDLFAKHSWYFRNALVRANYSNISKNIAKTEVYINRFLANLVFGEQNTLKNRELHLKFIGSVKQDNDTVKQDNDTVKQDNDTVKQNNDTVKQDNDTVKQDNDTVKQSNDTVKQGNDTVKQYNDTVKQDNDTVKQDNDTVKQDNDAENDTIFNLLTENPQITADEISAKLNMGIATIKRKIKILKERGVITRLGSDKVGSWKIN